MTERTGQSELFGSGGRARIEAAQVGGDISSDAGGALLLRQAERRLGVLAAAAKCRPDKRDPSTVRHSRLSQLKQRVFAIAMGYENLNDHDTLREDRGRRVAMNQRQAASSSPTLCRFENAMGRAEAIALHRVLIENFIASHATPPTKLTLDLDATDDAAHGRQEGRFSTATTTSTASCRCTCSAATNCWRPTCGRAISMARSTRRRSSD